MSVMGGSRFFSILAAFGICMWRFSSLVCARNYVTYGSSVSLQHVNSGYRLFSTGISWGSGSGQQAVTALPKEEYDSGTLWIVKEGTGLGAKPAGNVVRCGDVIRLEHSSSEKNLHSHPVVSPINGGNEVSGFGSNGNGDSSDDFIVECQSSSKGMWMLNDEIKLKHTVLEGTLRSQTRRKFTRDNCPRCPIIGHLEVFVSPSSREKKDDLWKVVDGVILSRSEDEHEHEHDEL